MKDVVILQYWSMLFVCCWQITPLVSVDDVVGHVGSKLFHATNSRRKLLKPFNEISSSV